MKRALIRNKWSLSLFSLFLLFCLFSTLLIAAVQAGETYNEIDVTRTFDEGKGAISCETGSIVWDGHKLLMTNTKNGHCMVPISTDKLENFRVCVKVSAGGGNNYHAGIFYGDLIGTRAAPGSIFFNKVNLGGFTYIDAFQSQDNLTKSILYDPGSSGDMVLLEMTKVDMRYRFYINGNKAADWTDTVSRQGDVRLMLGSFGTTSHGVFQDFKVYRLETSHEKDIPPKKNPDALPKKKSSEGIEIPDDLGEL
jgi:hypothetical protein